MTTSTTSLEVCRTCMNEFTDKSQPVHLDSVDSTFDPTTVRRKLEAFAPELDLSVAFSSVICTECLAAINFIHKFKKKCLDTEEYIQNYLRECSLGEENNYEDSFLRIATVESLPGETTLEVLVSETAPKMEFIKNKYEAGDLDISQFTQSLVQNGYQQPHLEIVDFESVLFNMDNDGEKSKDVGEEPSNNTDLVPCEVASNENSESFNNNGSFQHNYTIFETFNTLPNKRIILYKCNDCSYSLTNKSGISSHMQIHLKEKMCQCEQCGLKSCLQTRLIAHARTHRKMQVGNCNFATAFVSRIIKYKDYHKCDSLFMCINCNFVARTAGDVKSHLESHEKSGSDNCKSLLL